MMRGISAPNFIQSALSFSADFGFIDTWRARQSGLVALAY